MIITSIVILIVLLWIYHTIHTPLDTTLTQTEIRTKLPTKSKEIPYTSDVIYIKRNAKSYSFEVYDCYQFGKKIAVMQHKDNKWKARSSLQYLYNSYGGDYATKEEALTNWFKVDKINRSRLSV